MEIPRHWRLKEQRYNLIGEVCPHCDVKIFPPRDVCNGCGGETKEKYTFSGKGEIYSFTTIFDPPAGYQEQAPLTVALVKLDEGPMVTAQLTDFPTHKETWIIDDEEREVDVITVSIGDPVEMVTRKMRNDGDERGIIVYGYKFRPPVTS